MIPVQVRAPASCPARLAPFAADVHEGLSASRKTLPPKYFYDAVGSALFEAICLLPEYGVLRADDRVLRRAAPEIAAKLAPVTLVAELGSGSGTKTRALLAALSGPAPPTYRPIDISTSALQRCRRELSRLPGVRVSEIEAEFLPGLSRASRERAAGERLLALFLGGTLGNFERPAAAAFLRELRAELLPGDALLLGTDLVKEVDRLLLAYDDPAGVTAAFNLNVLARINRELGGDFDLSAFAHEARWDGTARRIEMHLRARTPQVARVPAAGLCAEFARGETIWTETSCKYEEDELPVLARETGFRSLARWVDSEWPFAESLWLAE
jgi:L-histidine Nalpha-methyltransferase